ncbi:hypothetical protein C8K61_104210 [Pseudomonas sp. GV071]|jgi:hypothetical protein|nr:hypothetical protein C8K61_104210 [Pseudomonas sp. GV071]
MLRCVLAFNAHVLQYAALKSSGAPCLTFAPKPSTESRLSFKST